MAAGLGVLADRSAPASLILALDTPALVERADHVVVADVVSATAAWDPGHRRIMSTVELTVVETWKGSTEPATHLLVVQPGGTVGGVTTVVFGMSRFAPGERALLFLRGQPGAASVVGMAQGKRPVRRDTATGRWMVDPADTRGARLLGGRPGSAGAGVRALDELRAEVRRLAAAGAGGAR